MHGTREATLCSSRKLKSQGSRVTMSSVMSKAEREAFLAEVHVGVLAIPAPDRGPLTAPV